MNHARLAVLDWLLSQDWTEPIPALSFMDWREHFEHFSREWSEPIDRAIVGGWCADRLAYAFAGGYQTALRRLVPSLPWETFASLCVTEEGGAHPKAIQTQLIPQENQPTLWHLTGMKHFVTSANEARLLLVAANQGQDEQGRNKIRVVVLKRDTIGVAITPAPDLNFVPEISHGVVAFDNVEIRKSQIFPGDGYENTIKPFRTVEDLHVFGGILAHLYRVARVFGWPAALREQIITLLLNVKTLAACGPDAPEVHIALGGMFRQVHHLLNEAEDYWLMVDEPIRLRWERDKPLLRVAESVRAKRLDNAWIFYGS